MMAFNRTPLERGVFVAALTAFLLLGSLLLRPVLEPNVELLFLAGVLFSAWNYGLIGGLLAALLSSLAVLYFFLPPGASFAIPSVNVLVRLVSFAAMAVLVAWVTAAWRGSKGLLSAALTSIGDAVIVADRNGHIRFLNSVAEALTGWRQAEARGKEVASVLRLVEEDTGKSVENPVERALREGAAVRLPGRVMLVSKEGTEIPIEHTAAPMHDDGKQRGVILVFRDITGNRQLEEQLRHSQKMDAVGRLAGGVAGDFNNLLTVITGYAELLRSELGPASPLRRFTEEILYAGERAAGLTRQLLAFSRGQAAQPRLIDTNAVIRNMEPVLRRLLGENNELILLPDPNLGRVNADPAQIEQVIMNLATNARDAMPDGGKLVLETTNVDLEDATAAKVGAPPGSYVMVAVSDTGVGMDAETRQRLFEPFFTTKGQGKGSGLGLSTVYGIVRQSGGQITVYSQAGCGTIFEIYLPRVKEPPVKEEPEKKPARPMGSETVLLVDDEDGVRKLVSAILQSNGYRVIEAANGHAALTAYEKNAHKIDLVLTDIVMPQMDGFELGERLSEKSPELKILFMSGYRDNPVGRQQGTLERPFLHKPFTPDVLLGKVREILDATSEIGGRGDGETGGAPPPNPVQ